MSVATSGTNTVKSASLPSNTALLIRSRLSDYAQLCRPRIAMMTAVAVAAGYTLAAPSPFQPAVLGVALIGITLLVAASSIFNQCLERKTDARMTRTANRPMASGRLPAAEAAMTATLCTVFGFLLLANFANLTTALTTLMTLVVYAFAYTPLKTRTTLCTTIGAIPGALPPVLGWLAAGGGFGVEAFALFSLFFVWQFPHFLAIGWIHKDDYHRAGLKMLPSFADNGFLTGLVAVIYAAVFVPVSMLPSMVGLAGNVYAVAALGLSACYLFHSLLFLRNRTERTARRLLRISLVCLPVLLLVLVFDFVRLTAPPHVLNSLLLI